MSTQNSEISEAETFVLHKIIEQQANTRTFLSFAIEILHFPAEDAMKHLEAFSALEFDLYEKMKLIRFFEEDCQTKEAYLQNSVKQFRAVHGIPYVN